MVMMASLLLGSCSSDDILSVPNGNGRIRFDVGVSQSQDVTVTPMNGSATRSAEPLFLPTSSIEMHSGDMTMYANCASNADIPMHNIVREKTTRGTEINESNFYSSFGLFGYFYDSDKSWTTDGSSLSPESSMNNLQITQSGSSWTTSVYWPGSTKKSMFFAYAPYDTNVSVNNSGDPKMTYSVPQNVSDQKDLLVAKSEENIICDGKTSVVLNFKHVLTALKFTQGDLGVYTKITEIKIEGVNNTGKLSLGDGNWTDVSSGSGNTYTISSVSDIMFLMPQTLPTGAKLSVTMANNTESESETFTADLSGEWTMGSAVTYQISVNKIYGDYVLEVTSNSPTVGEAGGNVNLTVQSYFEYSDKSSKINLPWTATCDYGVGTDTRTPIDKAVSLSVTTGNGGNTGETFIATIQKPYLKSQHSFTVDATLMSKAQNSASPFDLSTYNTSTGAFLTGTNTRSSANCYIIKAPGYYKLPLVYGNALNNLNNANGNGSATFKDANDYKISAADISGVKGAKLVWQDEYGLIDPSSIYVKDNYLCFHIKEDAITQGNALIAATTGENGTGDILWSWHIWVTDADFQNKVQIYGGATLNYNTNATSGKKLFNFMKVPLGCCDATTLKYPERKIIVTITQNRAEGKRKAIQITQTGSSAAVKTYGQNCTFYQWGRKDPFPGSDGNMCNTSNYYISTPKLCYDADGNSFEYKKVGGNISYRTTKGGSIKNPDTFYYSKTDGDTNSNANDWCSEITYNNWSSKEVGCDFVDHTVVKSLYDPCPTGFKVPETTCFTGFTNTGLNIEGNNYSLYNVYSETFNKGWNIYTTNWKTGNTDFWYALGIIDCWYLRYEDYSSKTGITGRGILSLSGTCGRYWTARAYSNGHGRHLFLDNVHMRPSDHNCRAFGYPVRPVAE